MPKNAHPPRDKPVKKSVPSEEDTSFIVFGDGKSGRKKGSSSTTNTEPKTTGRSKGKATTAQSEGELPKPNTRTLIAGASWTGKLPVSLLSEHFQKQQWNKPDYRIRRDGEQHFAYAVVLSKTNKKTQETTTLPPFKIPPELEAKAHQPTAVEARSFAAAYMLFRVASAKNLHMMLPPTYKDMWKAEFTDLKKADEVAGKAWMYDADPFFSLAERDKAKEAAAKAREKKQKERDEAQKSHNLQPGAAMPKSNTSSSNGSRWKEWERVPKIELGRRTRKEAEHLIRKQALWNTNGLEMPPEVKHRLINEISELGFRKSHVKEAADLCKDREEVIEWLLIHVPEDDLPSWSLPEGYVAGVSMASTNLKREGAIKRLAATGYSLDLCEEAYDSRGGDERKAAAVLQARLLGQDSATATENVLTGMAGLHTENLGEADSELDAWEVEMSSLEAIYDKLFSRPSPMTCRIELDIKQQSKRIVLQIMKPYGSYPAIVPIVSFEAVIPAYIRLSIIRQALIYAETNCIGMPMIYDIVDWLQQNAGIIFKDPGRLSDVSLGVAAVDCAAEHQNLRNKAKSRSRPPIRWAPATTASRKILSQWRSKHDTTTQQSMMKIRESLPAWKLRDEIVDKICRSQVTIISGETGSGKSTQSVQFILDDMIQKQLGDVANIICTQPRRISALGLADRVAQERSSQVGDEVGYIIRGESKQKAGTTKITFVTTGVLLRRLQTRGGDEDDVMASLADVTHIVVDEVHERSLDTDFLLILLRQILRKRKDLKVILMSATLDANIFEAYFHDVGPVARVEISGRTFPVQDFYLDDVVHFTQFSGVAIEDADVDDKLSGNRLRNIGFGINYDLIASTVHYISRQLGSKEGAILIFLPGVMEIERVIQALSPSSNFHALPLHASLQPAEQKRVFPPAPLGKRKVIAATNVAETSITIEDIVAVIDTGRVKETSYDPQNNIVRLAETWASRAACKQRRGRAGRVRAGDCFKLYTRNAEAKMMERPEPEIKRVPLEQLCLSIKTMGIIDIPGFLASAITPPESMAVEGAIKLLSRMGAITDNVLTALGRHLSMIPADLRLGKLLVYGATFGCLEAALTIASVLTARSPFISPRDRDQDTRTAFERIRSSFSNNQGDLIIDLRAYEQWSALSRKNTSHRDLHAWCHSNSLSPQTLFEISSNRSQYISSLKEISFIPFTYSSNNPSTQATYNKHNANDALLRALIAGSFNPQLARIQLPDKKFAAGMAGAVEIDPEAREIKYFNQDNGRVFVHPSSSLFSRQTFPSNALFIAYFNKMATSKVFVRDITPFSAYSLLMFAGKIQVDTLGRGLVVDGWIRLRGWARIGVLVSRLRGMLDGVLEGLIREPGKMVGKADGEIIEVVRRLVERDGLDA